MVGWIAGIMLTVAAVAAPGRAADHRDGPRIANNTPTLGNIDINDVYLFRSSHGPARTVMIMTLSADAGVVGPAQFHPGAAYEFRIDNTGDTTSDVIFQLAFSEPNAQGRQAYSVRLMASSPHNLDEIIGHGVTSVGSDKSFHKAALHGAGEVAAGLFDDPFFFDLIAFNKFIALADGGAPLAMRVAPFLPPNIPNDFFGGFNAIAIVLEVPHAMLRSSPANQKISLYCRTLADVGDGRGFAQYDRMGIPAINTAVIQPGMPRGAPPGAVIPGVDEDAFNLLDPSADASLRSTASARIQFGYGVTAAYADGVAAFVLPDLLPYDPRSSKGFPNGRQLANDVIDAEFSLLTNGALTSDRVSNDSVFRATFPYLGAPNPRAPTPKVVPATDLPGLPAVARRGAGRSARPLAKPGKPERPGGPAGGGGRTAARSRPDDTPAAAKGPRANPKRSEPAAHRDPEPSPAREGKAESKTRPRRGDEK
jgi:hypothetical protein